MDVTLRQLVSSENKPEKQRPLHEAQIAELHLFYAAYGKNPFKPGDLIMPRPAGLAPYAGEPYLVLETRENPEPDWNAKIGQAAHGARLDMRVIIIDSDGDCYPIWVESFMFEPYAPKDADGCAPAKST